MTRRTTVDGTSARKVAQVWFDRGWSIRAIAAAAGISRTTVADLVHGTRDQFESDVVDAVLGVTRELLVRHADLVPAVATRRRIQHMQVCGWSQGWIAEQAGITQSAVSLIARGDTHMVSPYLELQIERLSGRVGWRDGGTTRTKRNARRQRWRLATDWADIHDPASGLREEPA